MLKPHTQVKKLLHLRQFQKIISLLEGLFDYVKIIMIIS